MEFHIDNRESALISRLQGSNFVVSQLDIGDIQVTIDGSSVLLIERKTLADLEASVKDGRYKEQKNRAMALRASTGCKLIYLIEGDFDYDDRNPRTKINTGCVFNSMIRDEIPFVFLKNIDATVQYIHMLAARLTANPDKFFNTDTSKESYVASLVKPKKKDNIDEKSCFILQLCAIPGISYQKAVLILQSKQIFNMATLCSKMAQSTPKDFFKDVKGVGKILQGNIYRFCGIDANSQ